MAGISGAPAVYTQGVLVLAPHGTLRPQCSNVAHWSVCSWDPPPPPPPPPHTLYRALHHELEKPPRRQDTHTHTPSLNYVGWVHRGAARGRGGGGGGGGGGKGLFEKTMYLPYGNLIPLN